MNDCLNCGKELIHTQGRKEKLYCNPNCRQQYWLKKKPKEEKVKVLKIAEYDALIAKIDRLENGAKKEESFQGIYPALKKLITEPLEYPIKEDVATIHHNLEIEKQIEQVKLETKPSMIGKATFEKYKQNKIIQLRNRLK